MELDEKVCPRCAETVKEAALVCKHCNYEFGTPVLSAAPAAVSSAIEPAPVVAVKPKKTHPVLIGIGVVIVGIIIFGALEKTKSPSSPAPEAADNSGPPPLHVTAADLAQAYSANEVAAQQTYGGKVLDVTGTVTGVVLDIVNDPVVHLDSGNEFLPVQAEFDPSAENVLKGFSKGQTVTIECSSITSVISAPMLSDCSIPDSPAPAPDPDPAPATDTNNQQAANAAAAPSSLVVTFDVQQIFSQSFVEGNTNLPDNTQIMLTLQPPTETCQPPNCGYAAEVKLAVKNGHFNSGTLNVAPGNYILEITTPTASAEPPDVRAVIGNKGENLSGQYVKSLAPGVEPTVDFVSNIIIAPDQTLDAPPSAN